MVEAHRLVVEERRVERRRIMRLEVRARVGDEREAGGVRFGESIQRERADREHDAIGHRTRDTAFGHAGTQLHLDGFHALLGTLEPHRAPQIFGLPAGETGHHHRHAQKLLLEERHAERALEHRLEQRVVVGDGFAAGAAVEIGMHHLPHDRTRADDRHLHDEVVETCRLEPRQRGHLGARLDLEQAHGVGRLQHAPHGGVILRQMRQVNTGAGGWGLGAGACRRPATHTSPCVDNRQCVLQGRHHAQAEQIDLDEAHVGAVFLVPLHDDAARHAGVLERHDRRQRPLADDHAAGVLSEMARQVLHLLPQLREMHHLGTLGIHAHRLHVLRERVVGVLELEVVHHLREPVDLRRVEVERLPHFPRRALAAVSDDIGRHRRAVLPVFLVDVLDDAFTAVAARQIQIDVGPLAAFFREEALEEQLHAHRIDGRDAQAVADGAVGGRAAPLHEDVVLAAEVHDVPHDQEVAGEIEFLDERQFAFDLRAGFVVIRAIAIAGADVGDLAEERRFRVARRHRIPREAVAEILHRELEPVGQFARGGDGVRQILEEPRHLLRRLEIPLGVGDEPAAGLRQRRVLADAGEHVVQRPRLGRGEAHTVGGENRHAEGLGQRDEHLVVPGFVALQVPLQFHVDVGAAEDAHQPIEQPSHAVPFRVQQRPSGERHEAVDVAIELFERERAFPLRRPQLHPRDEAAEVAVPLGGGDEHGQHIGGARGSGPGARGRVGARRADGSS